MTPQEQAFVEEHSLVIHRPGQVALRPLYPKYGPLSEFGMGPEDRDKFVMVEVRIQDLVPTQAIVFLKGLMEYVVHPRVGPPDVIWDGHGLKIGDGHTRITAALLRGETHQDVRLYQSDGYQYQIPNPDDLPSGVRVKGPSPHRVARMFLNW